MAKTETQPYQIIKTEKDFEIRLYPSATMATISMEAKTYKELSSSGFRKLASFIFGGNNAKESIAMTSPVHMDINDSLSSMSFVMPANYNKANLPTPNDSAITIETTTPEYVAAIEFGGYANDDDIKKYAAKLENALKSNNIAYYGNFRFLGYNAPYQFWGRKNEIIVGIHWNEP
ncbi:MAG: heme-binding protein [Ginsengibacter sp.]